LVAVPGARKKGRKRGEKMNGMGTPDMADLDTQGEGERKGKGRGGDQVGEAVPTTAVRNSEGRKGKKRKETNI